MVYFRKAAPEYNILGVLAQARIQIRYDNNRNQQQNNRRNGAGLGEGILPEAFGINQNAGDDSTCVIWARHGEHKVEDFEGHVTQDNDCTNHEWTELWQQNMSVNF